MSVEKEHHQPPFADRLFLDPHTFHEQAALTLQPMIRGRRLVRRAGVLFEVMLAVALFGGAAAFTLGAVRSALTALEQVRVHQQAVDLAKSRMAELEAGLISLADVRDGVQAESTSDAQWTYDLNTSRSPFTNLTLIELTVRQSLEQGDDGTPVSCTLRQLIALRPDQAEGYEQDELTEGLTPADE